MTVSGDFLAASDTPAIKELLTNTDPNSVLAALAKRQKSPADLALLLSQGADQVLEQIAQEANRIKLERFGRTVQLYAPLYLSNRCSGDCPYCGFNNRRKISRRALSIDEIRSECEKIAQTGMRHVLLVSGSFGGSVSTDLVIEATSVLKKIVPSISIEVPALTVDDYRILADAGVDGVTLYQETYNKSDYAVLHQAGEKADFENRLDALDRAGTAGMRKLTVGALWGLSPWRLEALRLGMHAEYLQKRHWRSHISIGLPRLVDVPESFEIPNPAGDRDLAHIIAALRVFLEDAGLVLSTREPASLRDNLIPLGITQISAGSSTEPGGYANPGTSGEQFAVTDNRPAQSVASSLAASGYDPVFKDWDTCLDGHTRSAN